MKLKVFLFAIPLMLVGCGSLMFWTEKNDDFDFKHISKIKKRPFHVPKTAPATVAKQEAKTVVELKPIPDEKKEPQAIHVKPGERAK